MAIGAGTGTGTRSFKYLDREDAKQRRMFLQCQYSLVNGQWSIFNGRLFMIPALHCIVLHFVTASYSLLPHKKDQDQDQDQDQVHLHPPGETCNSSTRKNKDRTFLSIRQIYLFQLQRPKVKIQNPKSKIQTNMFSPTLTPDLACNPST